MPAAAPTDGAARSGRERLPTTRPRWLRIVRALLVLAVAMALVCCPWWGPRALAHLDYFHVRQIDIEGVRYSKPGELVPLLGVDTTQSVWQQLPPIAMRARQHPMVVSAEVDRRLPGTLVVRVVEREPVALVPADGMLRPVDVTGRILPINPAVVQLDVPVVASADSALLRILDALRQHAPAEYARITNARSSGADELQFMVGTVRVRTGTDVTVARFRDILPVEADLARNHLRAVELDLRFRDQVIARQP